MSLVSSWVPPRPHGSRLPSEPSRSLQVSRSPGPCLPCPPRRRWRRDWRWSAAVSPSPQRVSTTLGSARSLQAVSRCPRPCLPVPPLYGETALGQQPALPPTWVSIGLDSVRSPQQQRSPKAVPAGPRRRWRRDWRWSAGHPPPRPDGPRLVLSPSAPCRR